MPRGVFVTTNASGAAAAGRQGDVVVIVDVIDMSTTLEAVMDAGAWRVFGASPDGSRAPVELDPEGMGYLAGISAQEAGTGVIVVTEPRVGTDDERRQNAGKALAGLKRARAEIAGVIPNLGAETAKLADFAGKVVLAVTDTGGTAFDAAVTAGAPAVITGTVARTLAKGGTAPAKAAARRAIELAARHGAGITVVAASANSLEDILAAEYIARSILEEGFVTLR